jgi:hypothetical protein
MDMQKQFDLGAINKAAQEKQPSNDKQQEVKGNNH